MGSLVYTNAYVSIAGLEVSDHVKSVNITYEAELLDDTVMGTHGTRSNKPGLKNWSVEVNFLQDYDEASIDATLFALVGADPFRVAVRPTKGPASPTNPEYTGPVIVESYPPLTGEVGALGEASVTFQPSGSSCNLRRLIAPMPDQATSGTPGTWTPAPPASTVPDSIGMMGEVTASPTTKWAVGEHMVLGDGTQCHWNGTRWAKGAAPAVVVMAATPEEQKTASPASPPPTASAPAGQTPPPTPPATA